MLLIDFKTKNLLIIASAYPDEQNTLIRSKFVKNQVDELKKHFNWVYVIAPLSYYYKFTEIGKNTYNYTYDNVSVYFPYSIYIPLAILRKPHIDNRVNAVINLIKKEQISFDIIHAHMSEPSGYISKKLKEIYHVPYVLTIHEDNGWFADEVKMANIDVVDGWKSADALIRVNPNDIPLLKEYNPNSCYIANGYSPSFHPMDMNVCRRHLSVPIDKKVLFGLGILTERKGFQFLIKAMSSIVQKRDDVLCYIGGSGSYRQHLEELIHQFHLEESVFLLGRISDEELPMWMNACDVFVLPSLGEGNPTVMFEALGCGKPFVGTRVGGIPDVICSEKYGLLCEAGDINGIYGVLEEAIEKEWDIKSIQEYAKNFSWDKICKKIYESYLFVFDNESCYPYSGRNT